MSHVYLKMKIMSLAAEARIIRREELRWYGGSSLRVGLRTHRVGDVRSEARHALLAYGFLRGRAYAVLEAALSEPTWARVASLAAKYGDRRTTPQVIEAWAKEPTPVKKAA